MAGNILNAAEGVSEFNRAQSAPLSQVLPTAATPSSQAGGARKSAGGASRESQANGRLELAACGRWEAGRSRSKAQTLGRDTALVGRTLLSRVARFVLAYLCAKGTSTYDISTRSTFGRSSAGRSGVLMAGVFDGRVARLNALRRRSWRAVLSPVLSGGSMMQSPLSTHTGV